MSTIARWTRRAPRRIALLGLLLCAMCVSALTLTVEASEDATLAGDVTLSHAIQGVAIPGLHPLVRFCNAVGGGAGAVALTCVVVGVLVLRRRGADAVLVALTLLARSANGLLKDLVASPRPTADVVRITDPSRGFGFPSGHALGTVVLCGCLAYLAWRDIKRRALRLAVVSGAGLLALAVGFSRVYSGAHWPSDVLGAYLWGALFTVALIAAWRLVCGRSKQLVAADAK
jgi:undecaprenyl-diphosphatase